ncbi:transcriptional regulator GutM [Metabacillus endolithicus]|uniref:Transcriptional regulator GutM n=1 Tax=Metabacillus endolithicus TaxID=1535204 RepID=A0ABW5C1D4_9BACI|nr:transcriptional regulator GutM [Metabacillus endolithicus]UPG65293.1 transcriptional regulator GutM [Metabacillus endolithicus]
MKIAIILCCLLVIQYVLTFIQVRYYRKSMDKIISRYKQKEGYYLFSGMERRQFRPGAIAMIVVNNEYTIQECYIVNGFSVLSKFKELEMYKGQHVGAVLDSVQVENGNKKRKRKQMSAISAALAKATESALLSISKKNISMV